MVLITIFFSSSHRVTISTKQGCKNSLFWPSGLANNILIIIYKSVSWKLNATVKRENTNHHLYLGLNTPDIATSHIMLYAYLVLNNDNGSAYSRTAKRKKEMPTELEELVSFLGAPQPHIRQIGMCRLSSVEVFGEVGGRGGDMTYYYSTTPNAKEGFSDTEGI